MAKDAPHWSTKEDDDERPPLMYGSSVSDPESPDKKSPTRNQSPASGDKKDYTTDNGLTGASGKNAKPPAAAELAPKGAVAGSLESSLWTAFAESRSASKRMGPAPPLREWKTLNEDKVIPEAFQTWYDNQVRGDRSVPHALNGLGFPSGFPEFCHWVADGHHTSSGGTLLAGFEAMAEECTKRMRAANVPAAKSAAAVSRASHLSPPSLGGRGGPGGGRVGGMDPKDRKRRSRKGGIFDNDSAFAEKMKNAIAGLGMEAEEGTGDGTTSGEGGKGGADVGKSRETAADLASRAGALAEAATVARAKAELYTREGDGKAEVGPGPDAGEVLGVGFEGSRLPPVTEEIMSSLRRAKTFRRRSERQAELLESELEKCLARMARIEGQYLALLAESRGKECTLKTVLKDALPLIKAAENCVNAESAGAAVEHYDDAIKLLEVHVDQSTGRTRESEELLRARELLGLSLCNRSIIKLYLGDTYSGKRDAVRAEKVWPDFKAKEHLKRSQEVSEKKSKGAFSSCKVLPVPL